jgi:hypothetical protein
MKKVFWAPRLNNFQPRIGAAYKVTDKTVLRGGLGLTSVDLFRTGLRQSFEEYSTSVTKQAVSGDPRPAFYASQGPGEIPYHPARRHFALIGVNYSGRAQPGPTLDCAHPTA